MPVIHFETELYTPEADAKIGSEAVVMLPKEASLKLPTRGMTMIEGVMNDTRFRTALEPDGYGNHWFRVNRDVRKATGVSVGDTINFEIEPVKQWPEPKVPADLKKAIDADPQASAQWADITPMARWDWLRWVDSVKQVETRKERPEKLCSMLRSGKRRPCCFNRTMRTTPKNAELI